MAMAIFLIPFWYLPLRSIAGDWPFPEILPTEFNFNSWAFIFKPGNTIGEGLLYSLLLSISVAFLSTGLGFWCSRKLFSGPFPASPKWLLPAYLPYLLSPVLYASCLFFFFVRFDFSSTWPGVFLAQFLITFPYAMILWHGFWDNQVFQLEQQARSLGATKSFTFLKVVLPFSGAMLILCFFQCFLISWFEFGLTQTIGVGQVKTLTIQVYQFLQEANPRQAATSAVLLLLPPIILLFLQKELIFRQQAFHDA
jgi:putative spermidine/putrescine transport system permease protein